VKNQQGLFTIIKAMEIADVGNCPCPFYLSVSKIVKCAGGWMGQAPSSSSHACRAYRSPPLLSDAIVSYRPLYLPRYCRARPVHPMVSQVDRPPSPYCVST